jgi:hypothetical protein
MALTGKQYKQLQDALLGAFPTQPILAQMVQFGLTINLDTISIGTDLSQIVFQLIRWAEAQGRTYDLIAAARDANPTNPNLRKVSEEFNLAATTPARPELEKLLQQTNSFLDVVKWREALGRIEPAVCRIEIPTRRGLVFGTGFLLGSSAVMTNYHVMEDVIQGMAGDRPGVAPGAVVLRFDYKKLADGTTVNPGTEYKLPAQDWLIDSSPVDDLDYALIQVDGTPGDDPVGNQQGAPERGFLTPWMDYQFAPGTPLFIVQHPQGDPLKLALDTEAITGVFDNGARVRYRTNTLPGSSGSPCFNADWQLVALHHSGDPNFNPTYNEGIPFASIMPLLDQHGVSHALGKQEL